MKKLLFVLFVASSILFAQKAPTQAPQSGGTSGVIGGGLGMSWIKNDKGEMVPYYLINLNPEIAFMNFGVGLDLNLYVSSKDQSIRWQELQRGRFIRYIRYGTKGSETYVRLGILDYAKLGHGSILYNYRNSPSVDNRRIGAELDLDFGKFGLETVYGDLTAASVLGARAYVRPLQFTKASAIPIISGIEVGATYASDLRSESKDTGYVLPNIIPGGPVQAERRNDGSLSVIGFDLGLPLLRLPMINMTLYYDYSKIVDFGSGMAVGLETNFSGLGLVNVFTKFERRFAQTDQYLPSYFDAFYELDRYSLGIDTINNRVNFESKAERLVNTKSPGPGYFGSLLIDILGTFQINGSYQRLDLDPNSGILHLGTNTGEKIPLIFVGAGYDKKYITSNKDAFTLDDRSMLYAEIGYKPYSFMIVSTLYTWTFAPETDKDGNVTGYKPQKRITPKVSFVFPL
ncbi:MAG: hypothetical protein HYV29_08145 [Ignavibacteriales bacterium]|nr:hypothetical protein [Ignavibacteriales bacterium]